MNGSTELRRDAVLPGVLLVFTLWEITGPGRFQGLLVLALAAAVVSNAALVFRRRATLAAAVVVAIAGSTIALVGAPPESAGAFMTFLLTLYATASHATGAHRVVGTLVLLGAIGVHLSQDPAIASPGAALPTLLIAGFAWTAGLVVRTKVDEAARQGGLAAELEASREAAMREAADAERSRIARELHDIIAHNLSTIVTQAGAARLRGEAALPQTQKTLSTIEDTARETLDEIRRLLGLLRKGPPEDPRAPQPRLAHLDDLVAQIESAGLPVEVSREGETRPLPEGLELSAFRIIQEALTNVLKHAGPAHARVWVRYEADDLLVRVTDSGRGHRGGHVDGHGLIGIRERVELYGGQLTTANQADGGFSVEARLPIERPA